MSTIKAVLFDFDETLHDRMQAFDGYVADFLAHFCPGISVAEKEKRAADMVRYCGGGYTQGRDYYEKLGELWHWADRPPAETCITYYNRNFPKYCNVFPEAKTLFARLKELGYTVGVVTNGPSELQHGKLEGSGLMPWCDFLVVSGDVGVHKPDPRIFLYTAEKYGLDPAACVYVGDHPVNDMETALKAGMHAIRMNVGWFKDQGLRDDVPNITSILQVLDVLKNG